MVRKNIILLLLVSATIVILYLSIYPLYQKKYNNNVSLPLILQDSRNNVSENSTMVEQKKIDIELLKLENANNEALRLINDLKEIKNLRALSNNYTPILFVLAKLERKMFIGGDISNDILKLKLAN